MSVCIKEPNYFYRDFEHDLPKKIDNSYVSYITRITQVALPFISLYGHAGKVLGVGSSALRAITATNDLYFNPSLKGLANLSFSVVAIAGSVFLHPVGIVITSLHDLGLNFYGIYQAVQTRDILEITKQTTQVANNTLYLFTTVFASIELQIASLTVQVIVSGVSSISEFKKGNWLEGFATLAMGAIRIHQTVGQVELLRKKWKIEALLKGTYVGKLHEKWQFPSDHLPVGIEVDGVKIVSWNVLNNAYINWVTEKDSQGLNGSLISDLNIVVQKNGLTKRDMYVIQLIQSIASSNDMIALQECGMPFLRELQENLPTDWKFIGFLNKPLVDQDVTLYNSRRFTYDPTHSEVTYSAYPSVPGRSIVNGLFRRMENEGKDIRIVNAHIPGDPTLPGREEFARYVANATSAKEIMVALGDNNFERHEMLDAYKKAGLSQFDLHSPWCTNIDPYTKMSKAIDHIFVQGAFSRSLEAGEIMPEEGRLQETIDLLNGS
ncbi:MAG: hypothetical protein P4L16_01970 [Chlamydiales bacterium]|nr:hypothetical protein [Chlamydiales bacterium]